MRLLDQVVYRLAEWRASKGGAFHVSETPPGWIDRWGGRETHAGAIVSEETALRYSALFACVRILAETLASVPWVLFEQEGRVKTRARAHPLYQLLHTMPNPEMTSFELRETLMGHVGTWGNAYAEIDFDAQGRITALWPLRPDRMKPRRVAGELVYEYTLTQPDAQGRTIVPLLAEQVFHVRGLGFDGRVGYSPVALARESIGVGLATEQFGALFFGNGARPGGVLEHPGKLGPDAYKRLKEAFEQRHRGLDNASRLAILEEGMKYHQVGVPPEEAQFLETRTFQVRDIARWYRIPPHMLADLDRATFSNIEHLSIEFVQYTMLPWFVRWEQAVTRALLLPRERERYYAQFVIAGLLRGDNQSRYQAYAVGRQNGWLSANDIRALEDMNPVAGGDVYLVPLNMIPADQVGRGMPMAESSGVDARAVHAPEQRDENAELRAAFERRQTLAVGLRHRLQGAWYGVYADVAARVLRREAHDIREAARKFLTRADYNQFNDWLRSFFQEHAPFVSRQFQPVAESYGELVAGAVNDEIGGEWWPDQRTQDWVTAYVQAFAARHCGISEARVRTVLQKAIEAGEDEQDVGERAAEAVAEELATWEEQRATETARWESVRFNNALAVGIYLIAQRQRLIWRSFGESCPYCTALNGRVIAIEATFLSAGEEFEPTGAERPLKASHNMRHAPAHDGCDCMVVSG